MSNHCEVGARARAAAGRRWARGKTHLTVGRAEGRVVPVEERVRRSAAVKVSGVELRL
jgi:hypothetical protein